MHPATFAALIVALAAFLTFLLVLAVLYLGYRQKLMLHQERMSALEKGTSIPLGRNPPRGRPASTCCGA